MATPRKQLVDSEAPLYYHIVSRCARRSWLMGRDPVTGTNCDHRKKWLIQRIHEITPSFSVAVQTYAVMSNHFHLIVYYDPKANETWSDEEVATRWINSHPAELADPSDESERLSAIESMLDDPERLKHCRRELGSLSTYMKCLKQNIAQRANREDDQDGGFWSKRFYSGAILSEDALLTVMSYVDLNPVRAKITRQIDTYNATGVRARIRAAEVDPDRLEAYLAPCATGLTEQQARPIAIKLREYQAILTSIAASEAQSTNPPKPDTPLEMMTRDERWIVGKQILARNPRSIGSSEEIARWSKQRGFKPREKPLPKII